MATSIAYLVKGRLVIDEQAIADRFRSFRLLYRSVEAAAREAFRAALQELLEYYVTLLLGRTRYERRCPQDRTTIRWHCNRCGSQHRAHFVRNGHYRRAIATTWGYVVAIKIPMIRCKRCGAGYVAVDFSFLAKYVRVWDDLLQQALLDCALGLSLRRQSERQAEIGQVPLSLRTINRQVNVLVQALPLLENPLPDVPPVVQLDGIYFTLVERTRQVKRDRRQRLRRRLRHRQCVALVAVGFWPDGRREILGWALATEEGSAEWQDFLLSLQHRGLTPANGLLLACGDGGLGLQEALQFVYYGQLPFQLCIFHKIQRITHRDYLRDRDNRGAISRDAGYVLAATEEREVYARLKAFRQKWEPLEPASVRCFLRNFSRCLTYLHVDGLDAVQFARTTSHIERTMRELRRKLSQVGTLMTDAGAKATLTLLCAHLNARWNDRPWLLSLTKAALEVV